MRNRIWLLYPLLCLLLAFSLAGPALAQEGPPPTPHSFYGAVTIAGSPAPAGTEVEARGAGVMTGVEGNPITTTVEGQYGSSSPLGPWLVVQGYIDEGTPIEFYVNGIRAQCYDVATGTWSDTYPFHSGDLTELNLATEAPAQYDLTVDSTAGGSVTTPGEGTFTYDTGAVVDLVATPDTGYQFVNWTGDTSGIADTSAASTTITMNGDYSITANFALIGVTYDLTVDSTAGGSVTDPGEGTFLDYPAGTVVDLIAVPDAGYRFVSWTGDTGTIADVNAASTTITMNGDYSITASFAEVTGNLGDEIDATPPGGTLELPAGDYSGDVIIDKPITITGTEGETIIRGGITIAELTGSEVTIENLTITDYTDFGIKIVKVRAEDTVIIRNNTILGVEGSITGIQVDEVEGLEFGGDLIIEQNSISGNDVGIKLGEAVGRAHIAFNDIEGNEVGLESLVVDEHRIGATRNWWGNISGPKEENWNPSGTGDKIELAGGLMYYPWLTRDFQTVLDDNIAYFGLPAVELNAGWNIISTPIALDPVVEWVDREGTPRKGVNTWGNYVALGNGLDVHDISPAYRFDGQTQAWVPLTPDYILEPCDAIYVRMDEDDRAPILFSPNVSVPSKELHSGWNLVGLAWLPRSIDEVFGMRADEALVSVEEVAGGLTGYKLVVSPGVNQYEPPWIYIAGQTIEPWTDPSVWPPPEGWMLISSGYWVFMLNDGTLAGFTFTPLSLRG